jgi:hypothetical protein
VYEREEASLIYVHMYSYEQNVSPTRRRPARRQTLEMSLYSKKYFGRLFLYVGNVN